MAGRYPWRTGYYDMLQDSDHCLHKNYTMLPALLKNEGYSTHGGLCVARRAKAPTPLGPMHKQQPCWGRTRLLPTSITAPDGAHAPLAPRGLFLC